MKIQHLPQYNNSDLVQDGVSSVAQKQSPKQLLSDSVAWSERVMLESGSQQRYQRGFRAFAQVYQPTTSVAHYHSITADQNTFVHQQFRHISFDPAYTLYSSLSPLPMAYDAGAPLIELSLEQALSSHSNSQIQVNTIPRKSWNNNSIAVVDEQQKQINASTHNLHGGNSNNTPPLEENNQFAPKFSATTTIKKITKVTHEGVSQPELQTSPRRISIKRLNKSRGQQQQRGLVQRPLNDNSVLESPMMINTQPQLGEFVMQNHNHYVGPFNPLTIMQSIEEAPRRGVDTSQLFDTMKNRTYQSKSKARLAHEDIIPQMILNSQSVHQLAKSVLKSMERQPSVYTSRGRFRSQTRLQDEEASQVDFHRFNEDLEEMVQYRDRDLTIKNKCLASARHQRPILNTKEIIPQAYQEVSKFMEHAAPAGPNPVQQSLLLLSKCSLKMNISQEQQKIAQNNHFQTAQNSPRKPIKLVTSKSRLNMSVNKSQSPSPGMKKEAQQASQAALNRTAGSQAFKMISTKGSARLATPSKVTSPYLQKKAETSQGSRVAQLYNVKAPQDKLMTMFNSERKVNRDQALKQQSAAKYSTLAQSIMATKPTQAKLTKTPQTAAQSIRLLGRTTRASIATTLITPGSRKQTAPQTPVVALSPRSFPTSSENPAIYLGKNPTSKPRQSSQQQQSSHKIVSPGRLQNIHILRPSHVSMQTQAQISRPKFPQIHNQFFNSQNLLKSTSVSNLDKIGSTTPKVSTQNTSAIAQKMDHQQSSDMGQSLFRSKISETSLHRGMVQGSNFVGAMKIQRRYQVK